MIRYDLEGWFSSTKRESVLLLLKRDAQDIRALIVMETGDDMGYFTKTKRLLLKGQTAQEYYRSITQDGFVKNHHQDTDPQKWELVIYELGLPVITNETWGNTESLIELKIKRLGIVIQEVYIVYVWPKPNPSPTKIDMTLTDNQAQIYYLEVSEKMLCFGKSIDND